jgi:hypothetical protein
MTNRRNAAVLIGASVLGLALTVPVLGSSVPVDTTRLTFNGPVRLPGVTLIAGTYLFERVEMTNPDVIVVRNGDRTKVYYMGSTHRAERPAGLAAGRFVTIAEGPRGAVPAIEAWYPEGAGYGHAFVYPSR